MVTLAAGLCATFWVDCRFWSFTTTYVFSIGPFYSSLIHGDNLTHSVSGMEENNDRG